MPNPIQSVIVLGGGSAGFMAAVTLKRKLRHLKVTVIRSQDIGVIGVGEGSSTSFLEHFFHYLKLKPRQFYEQAQPTWKLGIHFLWGTRSEFNYAFAAEYRNRYENLPRLGGFYVNNPVPVMGYGSALMAEQKAFTRKPDGSLQWHNCHAFHIENAKLISWLENVARACGVEVIDATVRAERGENGVAALVSESGARYTGDLYVDASGFRGELLGRLLGEPFIDYSDTLYCNRAVIGGWTRTSEAIKPYTTAETMDAGWCWQIEHENWINRGYVYGADFIGDDDAREEFLRKNPRVENQPRIVKFRGGRLRRNWVGNVVAIGNSVGFVEPLEATALHVISGQCCTLADTLLDSLCEPSPSMIEHYNHYNTSAWDSIRDFLSIHYRFNQRLDTPFWRACRNDVKLQGAEPIVEFYRENGPSCLASSEYIHPSNTFGIEGYLTLMLGQQIPHKKQHQPTAAEQQIWAGYQRAWTEAARRGCDVREALEVFRGPKMNWPMVEQF